MDFFTVQDESFEKAFAKAKNIHGMDVRIVSKKDIVVGGFLGLFKKPAVELTCYIPRRTSYGQKPEGRSVSFDEEKSRIVELATKVKTADTDSKDISKLIMEELKDVKRLLQNKGGAVSSSEHENIVFVREHLMAADFSASFIDRIVSRVKSELTMQQITDMDELKGRVASFIKDEILVHPVSIKKKPCVFVVVGPTGVGKTTTIAKLAAMFGVGLNKENIRYDTRIITLDNYRIAAKQQIETYAKIMGIPVSLVENYNELERFIKIYSAVDMIFVDTIGNSPKDLARIGKMKSVLDACGSYSQVHLALSATTKTADIYNVLQVFEPFNYVSVIITKEDETSSLGNIISVLSEKKKPVSFITTGQGVPKDIEVATPERVLAGVRGFNLNGME
ncbi:flagellar biosynthesis protein FlhF [Spirochaetia bacterium 38H-sp]|uniref:Flagellar biosynthesis protein FlhF n=1 Tax=Rarispira pelagica TaxID=3141764 RepID=A0ABU9UDN9_9SPIR